MVQHHRIILTTFLVTGIYATLRYNVFKGVAWAEWPVYVLNKVFALSALLLLMIEILWSRRPGTHRGRLLPAAWLMMLLHSGISLMLLNSAYYPKYFSGPKLTWDAGWSMTLGAIAAVFLHRHLRTCALEAGGSPLSVLGILAFMSGVHAALLGYTGWFEPATWPGGMIPITLISFVSGCVALGAAVGLPRSVARS